jgi:hypothetical protein
MWLSYGTDLGKYDLSKTKFEMRQYITIKENSIKMEEHHCRML